MAKRTTNPEWYRWCIEVGELEDQRDHIKGHPHSMGPKWEAGIIARYQRRIDHLKAHEPPRYLGQS